MPLEKDIDISKQLTSFVGKGELSFEEISKNIECFYDNDPTANVLWDLSEALASNITPSQVNQIANMLKKLRDKKRDGKTAIVSPIDSTFGVARMLQTLTEVPDVPEMIDMRVFREMNEALQWLNEEK
jgi:hypothetical protein